MGKSAVPFSLASWQPLHQTIGGKNGKSHHIWHPCPWQYLFRWFPWLRSHLIIVYVCTYFLISFLAVHTPAIKYCTWMFPLAMTVAYWAWMQMTSTRQMLIKWVRKTHSFWSTTDFKSKYAFKGVLGKVKNTHNT